MTRNVSNYCGTPLKLWPADVDGAVGAAFALVPDADAERITEVASRTFPNKLDCIATQFAISRSAP